MDFLLDFSMLQWLVQRCISVTTHFKATVINFITPLHISKQHNVVVGVYQKTEQKGNEKCPEINVTPEINSKNLHDARLKPATFILCFVAWRFEQNSYIDITLKMKEKEPNEWIRNYSRTTKVQINEKQIFTQKNLSFFHIFLPHLLLLASAIKFGWLRKM